MIAYTSIIADLGDRGRVELAAELNGDGDGLCWVWVDAETLEDGDGLCWAWVDAETLEDAEVSAETLQGALEAARAAWGANVRVYWPGETVSAAL